MIDEDFEECSCSFSERQLDQLLNDADVRSKMKICCICRSEFLDDSYFGEKTCGLRECEEEFERIYGKKKKKTSSSIRSPF